ncbi:hypothetical protein [Paenibacillus cremeus]|uniref:Uncharacterized protein n=1 Tax=Paenibacillus cremeus TaxID=2163881 RepID=A0A559K081_9BACL|nr:hypothetical protein [Paenibacillus cremeus]TVY05554.1 hypothetical protein FPZ49_29665 [Paenibacillus cremeus]
MTPIHPINLEGCKPHYGKTVFVILKDGSEIVGTLSRFSGSQLILNEESQIGTKNVKNTNSSKKGGRTKKGKVLKTKVIEETSQGALPFFPQEFSQGFTPPALPSNTITLDLPMIAMVFVPN